MAGNVMRICQRCRGEFPDYKFTNAICTECYDELSNEEAGIDMAERCPKCGEYLPDDACELCDDCESEEDE
jgi:PHP family Zn ribbon phosphoesterase